MKKFSRVTLTVVRNVELHKYIIVALKQLGQKIINVKGA
jgi:hypothetical protein